MIGEKLKALGTKYADSPEFIPVPFLIRYLTRLSLDLSLSPIFVSRTLTAMGIPLSSLLGSWLKLYKAKVGWGVDFEYEMVDGRNILLSCCFGFLVGSCALMVLD